MKRRTLLRNALFAAPAVVASPFIFGTKEVEADIPDYMMGENHLELYEVSDNVDDFIITVHQGDKTIDISLLDEYKPHLAIIALHRHIQDILDDPQSYYGYFDITQENITSRATDDIIYMQNGWTITPRGKQALIGTIIEGGDIYSSIQVVGAVDYNLTRNIVVYDEHGNTFPYHPAGYARVKLKDYVDVTISYEAYKNIHWHRDVNIPDKLEPRYGVWVPEEFTNKVHVGTAIMPIFSQG